MDNKKPVTGSPSEPSNRDLQGVDKAPGEESGKGELVTNEDLKGKKVDRDINDFKDEPADQKK